MVLYAAWGKNGKIPDGDAPRARKSTKASKKEAKKEALLAARRKTNIARDANADLELLFDGEEFLPDLAKMSRNYKNHYDCVLDHSTAIRIYASQSITPQEIKRASQSHSRACRGWARMNCHLTPNFHLSEHNSEFLLAYGPPYGYWGYPMERHNGFLKNFTHNGHTGGELEATLMRGWLKYTLISDLVTSFNRDRLVINTLHRYCNWRPLRTLKKGMST